MAKPDELKPEPPSENPKTEADDTDDENGDGRYEEERAKLEGLFRRLQTQSMPLRVHDVLIKGNTKTKDYQIESTAAKDGRT
ncbi:unnamed protein product [Linum trigynum]|uniref:Uncharacterized protein n=1 Tax=Linum trigynum TaxID=586398 RepID=A0AAV2ERN9_9ROSI